ncbi:Protein of unknown function [Streptomyces sp. cf386]|uniref:DUF998 domain-containing protein n=1 Tax=Streptomyces sp. cf386 TaxID=1761904 RepID=UPI000882DF72|nr:DUF998 domain-containing protein [Streptomyces sp. cf386]SDM40591.1 Protein of unknown function [Streptomyces sp. cf386]
MQYVPRWALLSSGCAPAVLIAGWTFAALLEGPAYDPATQPISALAASGAAGFWVMNAALAALGVCHMITALGLRPAALPGRVALGAGGAAAFVVALVPPPSSGGSLRHASAVAVAFTLLAVWPVLAADRGGAAPWGLRPVPSFIATALMFVSAAWFVIEMYDDGADGAAERLVTAIQSFWPFLVVASCLRHPREAEEPSR